MEEQLYEMLNVLLDPAWSIAHFSNGWGMGPMRNGGGKYYSLTQQVLDEGVKRGLLRVYSRISVPTNADYSITFEGERFAAARKYNLKFPE